MYRNAHGRGTRTPQFGVRLPRYRTRAGFFDDITASQIKRLNAAWPELVEPVQFAVEDVPPSEPAFWEGRRGLTSRAFPSGRGIPARIVLYRMPLQMHHPDREDLQWAIHDELVLRLAQLYGRRPSQIDPQWDQDE